VNKNLIKEESVYVKDLPYVVDVVTEPVASTDKPAAAPVSPETSTKNVADPSVTEKPMHTETVAAKPKVSNLNRLPHCEK
jgi:hypothetical protein